MASNAPEYLVLVRESAFGVPVLTSSHVDYTLAGTFVIPIPESNGFTADFVPKLNTTSFGGGLDIAYDVYADQYTTSYKFTTPGTPALAAFLCNAAITRTDGTTATVPWAYTGSAFDLASFTLYHAIKRADGTYKRRKLVGCKAASLDISCSRAKPQMTLVVSGEAIKEIGNTPEASSDPDATEFPFPTDASYPRGPYLHSHTAGNVLMAGTAISQYESLSIKIANSCDPRWFESRFLSTYTCYGRKATADMDVLYKAAPNMRSFLQGVTDKSFVATWNNGTNSISINFGNKNHLTAASFDLQMGKERMQKVAFANRYDGSTGTDVVVTNT